MENNSTDTTKRAAIYILALVLVFVSVLASISWISTRPGSTDSTTIVAGIVALATPTLAAVLALLQGLNASGKAEVAASKAQETAIGMSQTQAQVADISQKVNGQLTRLIDAATQAAAPVPSVRPVGPAGSETSVVVGPGQG